MKRGGRKAVKIRIKTISYHIKNKVPVKRLAIKPKENEIL